MNVHTDLYPFMSLKSGCYQTQHGQSRQRTDRILHCSLPLDLLLLNSNRWWHSPPLNSPMRSIRHIPDASLHSWFHWRYSNTGVWYVRLHPEPLQWGPSKIRPYVIHTLLDCGAFPTELLSTLPFFSFLFFCQQITCFKAWNPSGYDDGLLRNALSKEDCAWFAWIHMIQNLPYCVLPRCPSLPPFFSPFFSYFFFFSGEAPL